MRAQDVMTYRYRRNLKLWKKRVGYMRNIFENGGWEDAHPSSYPSGHKLRKPSKESGIFQSLGTISFVLFYKSNQFIIGEITVEQYHQIEKTKQKQTTGEKKIYTWIFYKQIL